MKAAAASIGAAAFCATVSGYGAYSLHVIAPVVITGLTVASWALRPENRTIGVPVSATLRPA